MISWSNHLTNGGMLVLCDNVYIFVSVCNGLPAWPVQSGRAWRQNKHAYVGMSSGPLEHFRVVTKQIVI